MNLKKTVLILILLATYLFPQEIEINKIEPPNWWEGMNHNKVQLMVYGEELNQLKIDNGQLKISGIHEVESGNYLFVDFDLSDVKAGDYEISFSNGNSIAKINFPILKREQTQNIHQGFSNEDVIYLIMPDRFANGDISNDFVDGYVDKFQDEFTQARHGGDLQGIIWKLDYLKNLGVSTLWLTPVVENNTMRSYHGYSATDFYKVDPRLGNHELYKAFVNTAHQKGMKVIMDHVANHMAIDHPWIKNLPTNDWINGTVEKHLRANHHKMVFTDPHADSSTIKHVQEGWFVDYMPDLNHKNKFVANYIIQNTLWWIESTGVDGIREDTYPYCDQKFMSNWAEAILSEYPNFNIVGEVWTGEPAFLSGYQQGNKLTKSNSNLPALTDFGFRDALVNYLTGKESIYRFYNVLASDYLYPDAEQLVTFIDNHDVGRGMYYADSDIEKFKIAYHLLFTTRGIPQMFYGTEIGMKENEDHGTLRKNFPGGFPDDERDAFTSSGRTEYENDIYNFFQNILKLRKKYPSLSKGELIHFPPHNEVYVYLKKYEEEMILNIVNAGENYTSIDLSKYSHLFGERTKLTNLTTNEVTDILSSEKITVPNKNAIMFLVN
jgi:glycosidase